MQKISRRKENNQNVKLKNEAHTSLRKQTGFIYVNQIAVQNRKKENTRAPTQQPYTHPRGLLLFKDNGERRRLSIEKCVQT